MTESSDGPSGEVGAPGGSPEGAPPYPHRPGAYPPAPQPYSSFPLAPGAPRNGLGVASLVVGIVALLVSWTIFGGVALGVVAVILGAFARGRFRRGQATNGGVAIAGIVLGTVAAVAPIIFLVVLGLGTDVFNEDYQHCIGYHPGDEQACERYR
ncbi:DUF4190 domain-containing protein [Mycobacterium sp.]|uniref:DUF4190 domain-containing protein n=1 Tax=Mycobacterium sp. TaxID=1785 RepID=UPI003C7700E2